MSKQYWIMDPSETSVFISFESRGEAEDWMREKQAFITSETSILYQAKIVEEERQRPVLDQLRDVLGPAIEAAEERQCIRDGGVNAVERNQHFFALISETKENDKALLEAATLLGVTP